MSMRILVGLALSLLVASASAQPRDGAINEAREAAAAEACADDPECAAKLRHMLAKQRDEDARAEAIYQAKPAWQKLLGWLAFPAAFWALWHWVGRKPRAPLHMTTDNHTGKK